MRREEKQRLAKKIKSFLYRLVFGSSLIAFIVVVFFIWNNYLFIVSIVEKKCLPTTIDFECDQVYSATVRQQIKDFVTLYTTPEMLTKNALRQFAYDLKQQFPLIAQVKIARPDYEHMRISVQGFKPCVCVNEEEIMVKKSKLLPKDFFEEYDLSKIPRVEFCVTGTEQAVSKELFNFFAKIPKMYWDRFYLTYKDSKTILIKPKVLLDCYECVVDEETFFDTKKLTEAQELYEHLKEVEGLRKKKKTKFIFDLRFAGRIVIARKA
jgi:hypothetical protein